MRPPARSGTYALIGLAWIVSPDTRPVLADFSPEFANHPLGLVEHREYDGVAATGAHWMRMPVGWKWIEPIDDQFNWGSGLASWLNGADAHDINATIVVSVNQFWASGFGTTQETDWPSYPPVDLQTTWDPLFGYSPTYYDFIASLAAAYSTRIDRITIENEVNTRQFWAGTMDDYWRMVATARKAIDDAAPHIQVYDSGAGSGSWGAAVAQWMVEDGTLPDSEILAFVNDYYAADFYAPLHYESYSELVYMLRQPNVQENNKRIDLMLSTVPPYLDGLNFKFTNSYHVLPTLIEWMDRRLARYGHALPVKVNNEASNWPLGSAVAEGQNLFKMVVVSMANGVGQTVWFPYSNEVTGTPRRGLLDENGAWTKQADAFKTLAEQLGDGYAFVSQETLGENVQRFRFQRPEDLEPTLDIMWWDDGSRGTGSEWVQWTVPAGTTKAHIYEYDGAYSLNWPGSTMGRAIPESGRIYRYEIPVTAVDPTPGVAALVLGQNDPNPFRRSTAIDFVLPGADAGTPFRLEVFDANGRHVRTLAEGSALAGAQRIVWDGRNEAGHEAPAGSYFYRVVAGDRSESKRMLLVR